MVGGGGVLVGWCMVFLAAMSSSRSDDVTKSVRPFVRSHFFSFSVLVVRNGGNKGIKYYKAGLGQVFDNETHQLLTVCCTSGFLYKSD